MKTKKAIEHFGSVKKLAEFLDIWPHVIYRWGEDVPKARAYELEVRTKGTLKVKEDK